MEIITEDGWPDPDPHFLKLLADCNSKNSDYLLFREIWRLYMNSPTWRLKKEIILRRDGYKCRNCGCEANQAHHLHYETKFREMPVDLVAVCSKCNAWFHNDTESSDSNTRLYIENKAMYRDKSRCASESQTTSINKEVAMSDQKKNVQDLRMVTLAKEKPVEVYKIMQLVENMMVDGKKINFCSNNYDIHVAEECSKLLSPGVVITYSQVAAWRYDYMGMGQKGDVSRTLLPYLDFERRCKDGKKRTAADQAAATVLAQTAATSVRQPAARQPQQGTSSSSNLLGRVRNSRRSKLVLEKLELLRQFEMFDKGNLSEEDLIDRLEASDPTAVAEVQKLITS